MNVSRCLCAVVVTLAGLLAHPAVADELGDMAKRILDEHAGAVVTVRLVVKERWIFGSFEDDSSESVAESTGFVVAPDGTVVTSLAATDPEIFYSDWLDEDDELQIKTEITSLSLLYEDGDELDAEVVLRDRDLDLVFIRPSETPSALPKPIPLDSPGTADVFEHVIQIERYGQTLKRQCGGQVCRVRLVLDRPRRLYVIGSGSQSLGAPVFTRDGKLLGMVAMRHLSKSAIGERGFWSEVENFAQIVVTAADIAEAVAQLPPKPAGK